MTDPPIFPKGAHQLLGWSYAMEAVDSHERTAHAKLIEKVQDGEIRPFPTVGLNIKDLSQIEQYGLAAGIRQKVEESVTHSQRMAIWARYCDNEVENKTVGMAGVAEALHETLRRKKPTVADCVWYVVCTDKERESCTMYAIGKKHGIGIMTVCRDIKRIREFMRDEVDGAVKVLRGVFGRDVF